MIDDEHRVQLIDQAWNRAYVHNDAAALDHILADEWIAINAVGYMTSKAEVLTQVGAVPWPFTTYEFTEVEVRLYGDSAVIIGRLIGDGHIDEQTIHVDQRYLRVYVKQSDQWQAIIAQVTPLVLQP